VILQKKYDENVEKDIKSPFEAWPEISHKPTAKSVTKELSSYQRVIIYQSAISTYLKDVYPAIDSVAYIGCPRPELLDLAKIYGFSLNTEENETKLIKKLLEDQRGLCKDKSLPPLEIPL